MQDAKDVLDSIFLEMRWRCLSLAADLDRIERGIGGKQLLDSSTQIAKLRKALAVVQDAGQDRAAQVQMIFSDLMPPPPR